jgi:Na+-transporting NADH:ubiquinone oxidoreductase subunit C
MNKESFLYVVIFTFIVAFVFVFIIALADGATAERVARNRELVTAQAFLNSIGKSEDDGLKALDEFNTIFKDVDAEGVNRAVVNGRDVIVKQFQGNGLWGTITGVLAVDSSLSQIIGLDVISHSETPGLGGRIEEDWFKDQFRGEKIGPGGITVRKGEGGVDEDKENSIVDGITGASLTSDAMEVIINNEIDYLRQEVAK